MDLFSRFEQNGTKGGRMKREITQYKRERRRAIRRLGWEIQFGGEGGGCVENLNLGLGYTGFLSR